MRLRRLVSSLLGSTLSFASIASQPLDFSYCTVCHGSQGNGNPAIHAPKIAGLEPWYLKRQLLLFRSGLRGTRAGDTGGLAMQPMAVQLDDVAIDAVVAQVATFEPKPPTHTVRGDVTRGEKLYETCAACHGANGEGSQPLEAPALSRRSDWYLATQLELFRSGLRGFAEQDVPGARMRAAAAVLPDAQAIRDVVAYINTLTPSNTR